MFEGCKQGGVALLAAKKIGKSRIIQQGTFFRLFFRKDIHTSFIFALSFSLCYNMNKLQLF